MVCMTVTFTIVPDHKQAVMKLLRKLVHHARTDLNILLARAVKTQHFPDNPIIQPHMKCSGSSPQHRRFSNSEGRSDSWIEIVVIVQIVLRFIA